jgi:hypothetical protein
MPLQIRRGTTAQRLAITPLTGELIYDTTTGQIFVGNGTTAGGVTTTGISLEDAQDTAASLFSTGSHSGITFAYNDAAGRIDATVTVAATGPFDGDLTGSVFSDSSTLLVNGTDGLIVGNVRSNVVNFTGSFGTPADQTTNASLSIRGNAFFFKDDYDAADATFFTIQQHHSTVDANPFSINRTRGTNAAPTAVINGDDIADIVFNGHDGISYRTAASITVGIEGAVSTAVVPGYILFRVRQGASIVPVAKMANTGAFQSNLIEALTTNGNLSIAGNGTGVVIVESVRIDGSTITASSGTLTITGNVVGNVVGNLDGDITGSVFTDSSTRVIDGTDGRITTPSVTISNTGYLQLPVYADDAARNSGIPFPSAGMVIFNTTLTKFQGYTGAAWVDFN